MKHSRAFTWESAPTTSPRGDVLRVFRFDGTQKSSRPWNALRRDVELWQDEGNCLVHLYAPGTSQRGPSLRVPFDIIEQSNCPYLFGECLNRSDPHSPSPSVCSDDNSDSGYGGSIAGDKPSRHCELHIPAPFDLTRHEVFLYHVGTRNYFAYLLGKPVVGEHLGAALAELARRIETWQPEGVASTGFLDYCQTQGYRDYAERIEYAVASLYLADQARIQDVWVEAFAHCVGMCERLEQAPETERLSQATRALVRRAALTMELHVGRMTASLGDFLEKELGPESLGLSGSLRRHLDRFRSFLHAYYVNQVGYFPPEQTALWDKRVWTGMYEDFRSVYAYLADTQSSHDLASNRSLSGGICAAQNVVAFDARHNFAPLPHPLPLEPQMPLSRRATDTQKSRLGFKLGRSNNGGGGGGGGGTTVLPSKEAMKQALACASNTSDPALLGNGLVQAYVRFESERLEEKVSVVEARKVRWILIYGALQMLISITRAPSQVLDTHKPTYPLCLDAEIRPSWWRARVESPNRPQPGPEPRLSSDNLAVPSTQEDDRLSIHPDCEADSAEDFFSMNALCHANSDMSMATSSAPMRSLPQMSRSASIRSSVNSLQHSIVGSFSRRNSQRRNSLHLLTRMPSFFDTVPEDLHHSTTETDEHCSWRDSPQEFDDRSGVPAPAEWTEPEAPMEMNVVPTLELHQLTALGSRTPKLGGGSYPRAEPGRRTFSFGEEFVVPTLDLNQLSGAGPFDSRRGPPIDHKPSRAHPYSDLPSRSSFPERESSLEEVSFSAPNHDPGRDAVNLSAFRFGFEDSAPPQSDLAAAKTRASLHAGCYVPTGATGASFRSRAMTSGSISSDVSSTSSHYPETSQQAWEIEEEETRGRIRIRRFA